MDRRAFFGGVLVFAGCAAAQQLHFHDYTVASLRELAQAWLARYARESERARRDLPARLHVAYGAHPGERLDVFVPPCDGPKPIHVFIHGGYWHRLDKADFSFVARAFLPAGAAVVVINYALIPSVGSG